MKNTTRFPQLMKISVLRDLPDAAKTSFLNECKMCHYDRTTPVLTQGDTVTGMYIIAQGSIEITSTNELGQTVLIHLSRPGEVFGEIETLSENLAAANCIAAANTVLLLCPKPLLTATMSTTHFMRNILNVSYERLVRDNQIKFVDQFYSVEQRLCDYLYRLSVNGPAISKTQADLAGLLGCARQTLNRELGKLRDRQIIAIEKGKIQVQTRETLLARARQIDTSEKKSRLRAPG